MEKFRPSQEEITRAENMLTDEQGLMSEQREKELRREYFEKSLNRVCEKYPELSTKIRTSLETPQIGEHHNEGARMDSHLSLILTNLEAIREGNFPEAIAQDHELREIMTQIAVTRNEEDSKETAINPILVEYTFFHDIAKPDCLTLKVEGEKKGVEITWEKWKEIEKEGEPYRFEGRPINSVSYFHSSEGAEGQHGNKGVKMLEDKNIPPEILTAISKHEVAYQFGKINAATYEEHFIKPGFTEDQQKFILVASYIDTMASLLPDQKPDLGNFLNLINSRKNYLLIRQFIDRGASFRDNDLAALKKQDKVLMPEDIEKVVQKEEKYNPTILSEKLNAVVDQGQITAEEKAEILSIVSSEPKSLGKRFGSKMRFIKSALEESREK